MKMRDEDIYINGLDLRQGVSIGGWDMEWTMRHLPTGCEVRVVTHGSYPQSQHRMRELVLMALELLVEVYDEPSA